MNNENLIGSLAMVDPKLDNDPAENQGQVGAITYISKDEKEVFMSFPGREAGVYSGDDVLKLKNKNEIASALANSGDSMKLDDFKALYKVSMLQDKGTATGVMQALEIIRDNPAIRDMTVEAVAPQQNLQLDKTFSR